MNRDTCEHGTPTAFPCRKCSKYWNDGHSFALAACGWQGNNDPVRMGTYVVRDSIGNMEVATWLCDNNGRNGAWTKELRDVDRENIVAWHPIADFP